MGSRTVMTDIAINEVETNIAMVIDVQMTLGTHRMDGTMRSCQMTNLGIIISATGTISPRITKKEVPEDGVTVGPQMSAVENGMIDFIRTKIRTDRIDRVDGDSNRR